MKRHTKQDHQQKLGQYYTTNVNDILAGYEVFVIGQDVIDPFAGGWDLLNWAKNNGADSVTALDIEPKNEDTVQNNSLINPPDYTGKFLLSNPPYLSANKCKDDKSVYKQWDQNDYYKCHIASLADCNEGILIIPSNFICESNDKARKKLFQNHSITHMKYWHYPAFDDATVPVVAFHFERVKKAFQSFECELVDEGKTIWMELMPEYKYLFGKDFFDYINRPISIVGEKTDVGMPAPNTNIVVGLLDNGKWASGLSYNDGDPIYCNPKSFTTYQLTTDVELTEDQQLLIVEKFQDIMGTYREKYHSMFLSNYMGEKQKILSRSYVNKLFNAVYLDYVKKSEDTFNKLFEIT